MPNAKDAGKIVTRRFLLLGGTGTGKSAQILTLPGKKFAYAFDSNCVPTWRGHDIDYEEWLPTMVSLDAKSLRMVGTEGNKKAAGDNVMSNYSSEQYKKWEESFEKKYKEGFFDQYDVIGFDSCTTFLDLAMDRILAINGRSGTFPQQDDYGPQMVVFTNVMRAFIGLGKTLFVTGHLKTDKDEFTQRIIQLPMFTGQLREKIPLLFSDIFVTRSSVDPGKDIVKYILETVPNQRETPIRTNLRGLSAKEDVTIDWNKPIVGQGLGRVIAKGS